MIETLKTNCIHRTLDIRYVFKIEKVEEIVVFTSTDLVAKP